MSTNNFFSSNRFIILVKREVLLNYKVLLVVLGSIVGIITLGMSWAHWYEAVQSNGFNSDNLIVSLAFLCIIWASISFVEIINTSGRQHYLSIPASHFEKLLSKWFTISLILPILFIILYIVYAYLCTVGINIFSSRNIDQPSFVIKDIIQGFSWLIVVQSIFYLGSISWPKYSLFKTILFAFATIVSIGLISAFFVKLIFIGNNPNGGFISFSEQDLELNFNWITQENLRLLFKISAVVGSLFLMTVAYFKLKEKEL
ncbi:MAG: hypothetical protein IT267_11505 [Saprospiraceae bacterium]|nr:hypothetical protein [Saprospiraceae bacterium]